MADLIIGVFFLFFFTTVAFVIYNAIHILRFRGRVFNNIETGLFEKIDNSKKPNKAFVKTTCDNCGAKCTNAKDISPSGDLKCEYCNSWFNVLRL